MTRVAIVAARAVWRAGLQSLLASEPALRIVGAFADASVIDGLAGPEIDVLLLQADPQPPDFEDALLHLPPCVLLTGGRDPGALAEALRAGVRAVLPGDAPPEQSAAAIAAVAAGLAVLSPDDLPAILAGPRPSQETLPETLTPREIDVLRRMADGLSNKQIAAALHISDHTVKFHISSIMGKLEAGSRTEAVMRGIRRGLVIV